MDIACRHKIYLMLLYVYFVFQIVLYLYFSFQLFCICILYFQLFCICICGKVCARGRKVNSLNWTSPAGEKSLWSEFICFLRNNTPPANLSVWKLNDRRFSKQSISYNIIDIFILRFWITSSNHPESIHCRQHCRLTIWK